MPAKSLFLSPSKFWGSVVGLQGPPPRGLKPYPSLLHPEPRRGISPLLTRTSTGNIQIQFCLSLCGISGSWCAQGLFEPSECLWRAWALILNANSPLPQSCWGFSFALGYGVSPHKRSSATLPNLQSCAPAALYHSVSQFSR